MNRGLVTGIILFCLIAHSGLAQRYPKKKILRDIKELPGFENAFIGFTLYDPIKDKVIAEQYADQYMTPASVTKLFTFNIASKTLPETLVALEYVVKGDSLIFWSNGYPLTLHPDQPDSTVIEFLAESNKKLFYWSRPMEDERFGPGWGWDDYLGYYGAEKSLFPIYGNSVRVIIDSKNRTFSTTPAHSGLRFTESDSLGTRARVLRDEFWNEFEIQYKELEESDTITIDTLVRPFRYSNALFLDLLGEASGKKISQIDTFERPDEFQVLNGVQSDSLSKWMLQPSDNLFAEQMLLMSSGVFNDTLSTKFAIELSHVSVKSEADEGDKFIWRDGSGLSRYNMFKPNEIRDLLKLFNSDKMTELLPQGQTSGTLEDWYSPGVYAKTGTLSNHHSLAGYIRTDKGKTLIFVIMANHYTASTSTIRESFGIILEKIIKGY
ncbi:D-alanyl-D-alanine carboxypeptidase [Roseivirga sp. E12]|uniref:D-alanyl-D-alanine carboxypeptidase n=1 Tax=Roseivirga sp. E12 TaxID=2819237 RepID=UPI001ABCC038|nr:D-alanyl-D-alanine carboxypeptidase [Roseivirga sp. E12]MBO3700532.1 D-alanyl-D-alanine carboxypeptidase [Roseivirga sp. E12]